MSIVTLRNATVQLGDQIIWQDANVRIEPGTITAVLGPNGAGKSTLLNVIMGLTPLAGGDVRVLDQPAERGNAHVGYMAQTRVADATATLRASDYVGLGFDGVRFGWRRSPAKKGAVANALRLTGAQHLADRAMASLSGGQRQRVALAHALVFSPELVLLDEPLAALDLAAQAEIVDLINLIRDTTGAAIVVVAHDLNPLAPIVDQVLWIARRQVRSGAIDDVVNEATLSELYGHPIEIIVTPSGRRVIVGLEEEFAHPHPHGHDHAHETSHAHFAEFYPEEPSA